MECYRRGFIWAKEGVRYMENFSENRDHYPSFSDFMPQLVGLMEGVADNIEAIKKNFYTPPYIVTAYPANGSTVSADISEIVFRFSQPMETGNTGRMNTLMLYELERNSNPERNTALSFLLRFTTRTASIQMIIMFMNFMLNNPVSILR